MKIYTLTQSVNAGFSLQTADTTIWIDALHDIKAPSYSTITAPIWERMQNDPLFAGSSASGPDAICFTHCHIDHFSAHLCSEAKQVWPHTRLILPEKYFPEQETISPHHLHFEIGDFRLDFIRSKHSTKSMYYVNHYALFLTDGNASFFFSGDTAMRDEAILDFLGGRHIDLAVMNFTWLYSPHGISIVEDSIHPDHLLIDHLPAAADDVGSYLSMVRQSIPKFGHIPDVRYINEPFTSIRYEL